MRPRVPIDLEQAIKAYLKDAGLAFVSLRWYSPWLASVTFGNANSFWSLKMRTLDETNPDNVARLDALYDDFVDEFEKWARAPEAYPYDAARKP